MLVLHVHISETAVALVLYHLRAFLLLTTHIYVKKSQTQEYNMQRQYSKHKCYQVRSIFRNDTYECTKHKRWLFHLSGF